MGGLAADACADDAGCAHRQRQVEGDGGLCDRRARGHHGELRNAVERGELTLLEMLERVEVLDLGGDFLGQLFRRRSLGDRAEAADPLLETVPVGSNAVAERGNGPIPVTTTRLTSLTTSSWRPIFRWR